VGGGVPPGGPGGVGAFFRSRDEYNAASGNVDKLKEMWLKMMDEASFEAIGGVNDRYYDYHNKGNAEELLRGYAPFTTWQLRNPVFWAQAFLKHPNLLSWVIRYFHFTEQENAQRNLTSRFNRTVGTNIPEGNVVPAGYYATDPSVLIPVLQQFKPPFEAPGSLEPTDNNFINAMRRMAQFGRTMGISPYPWISYPMEYLGILPKGTTQISLGPIQRIAELIMQTQGKLPPGGSMFGENYASQWLYDYYAKTQIAFMEAEGRIGHEEALQALMDPNHPVRQQATMEVVNRQAALGTVGNVSYLTLKYASPGEMIIRGIKGGMQKAEKGAVEPVPGTFEDYEAQRLDDWLYTQYPFLETYSLAMGDDMQRVQLAEIFFRYEESMNGLHPWEQTYKELVAQRSMELEKIYGPSGDPFQMMDEYIAKPITVGGRAGVSEYEMSQGVTGKVWTPEEARVEVMSRLRNVEPRASTYMGKDGEINWDNWEIAHESFMDDIESISTAFGYQVGLDEYLSYRYRRNNIEEVAYDMYKNWVNDQWDTYAEYNTKMQPGTAFYQNMVNTAAQMQYTQDLAAGYTPYEADIIRAQNLKRWTTEGLDYVEYEYFRKKYIDPLFAVEPNLSNFAGRVAEIMGFDTNPASLADLESKLDFPMAGISKPDPFRDARTALYDYFYDKITPAEREQVKQYFGIDKIPEDDAEMMKMYIQVKGMLDPGSMPYSTLIIDEMHGGTTPIPPFNSILDEEELAEMNQFAVDLFRYSTAREAGVGGTWTPLLDKYLSKDTPSSMFWEKLTGVSLKGSAYDDPVLGPFLSRASRTMVEFSDDQWEGALEYLGQNWDTLVNVEETQEIRDHPDWYILAQEQRAEYDRFKDLDMEVKKSVYYSIPNDYWNRERWAWEAAHPDEATAIKDYLDRELTRAFQYPYFMYFFKKYDYGRYFGGASPDKITAGYNTQKISDDFQAAIDEMNEYINGSGKWTDLMQQFFGPPPPGYMYPEDLRE